MPNLQELRRRVGSVRNMQKITKAMKMVAASRLRRAQQRVVAARPYSNSMARVLGRLAERAGEYKHPLLDPRGDSHYLLVLITGDRGLCGAFNANLTKAAQQFLLKNSGKKIELVTIGRKGRDFFRRRRATILAEYTHVADRGVSSEKAAEIAREVMQLYTAEDSTIDAVFLIYSEFKSALSQQPVVKKILPIGTESVGGKPETETGQGEALIDYLYEQPPTEILGSLLPAYIENRVFYALLESTAGELGAKMTAMDSASNNAGEVIDALTLTINRVRQASITREIIEVVSGAQALD
jgi:F-type H+-transporting ATPase subunit gamma